MPKEREQLLKEIDNAIKERQRLQGEADKVYSQLNLEERKNLPDYFWDIFDK